MELPIWTMATKIQQCLGIVEGGRWHDLCWDASLLVALDWHRRNSGVKTLENDHTGWIQ